MEICLVCEEMDYLLFDSDRIGFLATAYILLSIQLCHNVFNISIFS